MIERQSNVLVVEDELFFRKLYRTLLEEEGYRVEVCDDGVAAMECLHRQSFDLVITDVVMPGHSGLEVLRAARALASPPEVILVTGHASLESAIDALKNGARDYLIKPFNPEEFKHIVRSCLDQRHLLMENDHLRRQIELYRAGQALSCQLDLDRLLVQALEAMLQVAGANAGFVFQLKDGATPALNSVRGLSGDLAEQLAETMLPVLDDATELLQPDEQVAEALLKLRQRRELIWMLPLLDGGVLKGGIVLCDVPDGLANSESLSNLRFLCDQIFLGFDNACRYQDAQELMYTDDLTGLYNHRYLQVALSQEIKRSQRYGLSFSLLFMDLDRFKEINDNYGHLAGSATLREIGRLLQHCVRDVDTLFRYGGDEFAAILVETDGATARLVAERIRRTIEGFAFLSTQDTPARVTVTAGYATYPDEAAGKEQLLELADRAMYAGKQTRNTVRGGPSEENQ